MRRSARQCRLLGASEQAFDEAGGHSTDHLVTTSTTLPMHHLGHVRDLAPFRLRYRCCSKARSIGGDW
jgi:hypothetical protein